MATHLHAHAHAHARSHFIPSAHQNMRKLGSAALDQERVKRGLSSPQLDPKSIAVGVLIQKQLKEVSHVCEEGVTASASE